MFNKDVLTVSQHWDSQSALGLHVPLHSSHDIDNHDDTCNVPVTSRPCNFTLIILVTTAFYHDAA